jgi:circadian clock protein KaiB
MPRSNKPRLHQGDSAEQNPTGYSLRLYVTGATNRSSRAIRQIQSICERYLNGRYKLEIVDLYEQPGRAAEGQIIAAPTLIKESPEPPRRLVGDLTDERRVLSGLGLPPAESEVA